jgi:hypothetical protein
MTQTGNLHLGWVHIWRIAESGAKWPLLKLSTANRVTGESVEAMGRLKNALFVAIDEYALPEIY